MKFCVAAFLPAALAFSARSPSSSSSSSRRPATRLAADAVATATYTFTKSEEIFAEAKTVRWIVIHSSCCSKRITPLSLTRRFLLLVLPLLAPFAWLATFLFSCYSSSRRDS
jgi:hypothetical protein